MSRFLIIGLDGFEPALAEAWMDAGHLPNLARLRDEGTYLPLASTSPPATFPAWTTCVTGVNPGRHGIFDFTEVIEGQYGIRFVNATFRKTHAVWNVLSDAGKRAGVLGVPATYPPEPVNGFMVAGFDSPVATSIDRSFVYPPELYDAVRDWRFAEFQESNIGPGWHGMARERLLAKIDDKAAIAEQLFSREPWDFFMVVFSESDTVAHHFWLFHDTRSPRHQPGPGDAIREVYEKLDAAVGRLVAAAGEDVTIAVVSDHGFGGAGTGVVHLNNWLHENGYLAFAPGCGSGLKRLALTCVPQRLQGALFRAFRGVATRAESRSRFSGIDWRCTTAWSEELNYFPSIRINLQGREPDGQVAPHDYDSFCRDLCAQLEAWEPINRALPRDQVYSGPHVARAPDILLELALEDGYSHSCLRSRGGPPFRRIRPDEVFGGRERGNTGNHRPNGVLFLSKPAAASGARLEDIAPTVLAELGVPGPPMDGTSLLGPLAGREDTGTVRQQQVCTPEQEWAVEQRLRNLGYFE